LKIKWEGTDVEGQPTLNELMEAETTAIRQPTGRNLDSLYGLSNARTTYYGQDYRIGFRIQDFLEKYDRPDKPHRLRR
jgi:hypothetical protein